MNQQTTRKQTASSLSRTDRRKQVTVHNNKTTTAKQTVSKRWKKVNMSSTSRKQRLSTDKIFHCCIITEVGIMRLCTSGLALFRFWIFPSHSISKTTLTVSVNMLNRWVAPFRQKQIIPTTRQPASVVTIYIYVHLYIYICTIYICTYIYVHLGTSFVSWRYYLKIKTL